MDHLVHVFTNRVRDLDGHAYTALARGSRRRDGTWVGWLEFIPIGGSTVRRTERETTQASFAALRYWALGLEEVYLEGALERAISSGRTPPLPSGLA